MIRSLWCAALLVVIACGRAVAPTPPDAALSLLWISLDTLRADHLPLHGYQRDTAPFLSSLAQRGLYFDWAISPQNSTLPVHLTMFTGIHPVVHGIYHSVKRPGIRLVESVPTLPKILAEEGFATRARVDGAKMKGTFGFAGGFELYDDVKMLFSDRVDQVLDDLDGLSRERFFYFIHTYEIHAPYAPPPSHDGLYRSNDRKAPEQVALDQYDASIRFVDDELRRFVTELELRGLLDSTVLVITSDHGETFKEYGIDRIGHRTLGLYQNITRVPWIILHPDPRYRGRIDEPVGLIDFANTTLALLGLSARLPGGGIDVLFERQTERPYLSWTGKESYSLYQGNLHNLWSDEFPDPRYNALFNTAQDPLERHPLESPALADELSERTQAIVRRLKAEERRIGAELRTQAALEPSENEALREIRALGYID